jgi:lmbE family protein
MSLTVAGLPDNRLPAVWAEAKQQVMTLRDQTHAAEIPDLVIGPQPGDAHQDHRLVAELLGQAFRQQPLWGYEIVKYESDLPQVTGYVPFQRAEALAKSELLHRYYPSQVAHPWFDEEAFLGLMRVRGCQCLAPYAEGFVVTKTIVEIGGHR